MAGANPEPSMEEILSSIKRIIAEDSDAALSAPRAKRSVGLSPMTPPKADVEPDPEDEIEPDVLELTDTVPVEPEDKPVRAQPSIDTEVPQAGEPEPVLVSPQTAQASRSSLAALSALIVKPEVTGSDTLEGLVRDMLKPMLAEWLDTHLPAIVDRQVAQEIARITARG